MNFKHIETGQLNNELLNDDEDMLILKSESNKNVLVLRFTWYRRSIRCEDG